MPLERGIPFAQVGRTAAVWMLSCRAGDTVTVTVTVTVTQHGTRSRITQDDHDGAEASAASQAISKDYAVFAASSGGRGP